MYDLQRGVFVKHANGIYTKQGGGLKGTIIFVRHRSFRALQAAYRGIGIKGQHQLITFIGSIGQQVQVAMVQDIETAIGENDLLP